MKDKIADYCKRKAEDKRERDRLKYSKEYQPEQNGFVPERR